MTASLAQRHARAGFATRRMQTERSLNPSQAAPQSPDYRWRGHTRSHRHTRGESGTSGISPGMNGAGQVLPAVRRAAREAGGAPGGRSVAAPAAAVAAGVRVTALAAAEAAARFPGACLVDHDGAAID